MAYDIIGDIHGYAYKLESLLKNLGYTRTSGSWRHPGRKAVFLGDFIDRGPEQIKTVQLVRSMVGDGNALSVMGNHEFNAICYFTPDPDNPDKYLRTHDTKHENQHKEFLKQLGGDKALYKEIIQWFQTLPLWLDLPGIRVVHACWHPPFINYLKPRLTGENQIKLSDMAAASRKPKDQKSIDDPHPGFYKGVDAVLKGLEVPLPEGTSFQDKDGNSRERTRISWWDSEADNIRSSALGLSEEMIDTLPSDPLPDHLRILPGDGIPVFFGHYWMKGSPRILNDHAACLDYSVAKNGVLCAYRWDGEDKLDQENLYWV